jgi:hypothetical protein
MLTHINSYYVASQLTGVGKALTFVPQSQVQQLIDDINAAFSTVKWRFTKKSEEDGICMSFNDSNPALRPKFLGHTYSQGSYNAHFDAISYLPDHQEMFPRNDCSLEAFKAKMVLASETTKKANKGKRTAKHEQRLTARQEFIKQLLRAQQYLGLKPVAVQQTIDKSPRVDTAESVPYVIHEDVVFIAIDVEAWERNQNTITEVGVATLDTRDIRALAPGKNGKNWHGLVRARHFRVTETRQLVNKDFVQGCPDNFEFGESEFVPLADMPSVLTSCFHKPFSKKGGSAVRHPDGVRQIVLVGHDTMNDIKYCQQLGFSVTNRGNLREVMDTATLYKSYKHNRQAPSLGNILAEFDISGWYLHNAGNDAVSSPSRPNTSCLIHILTCDCDSRRTHS